MSEEFQNTDQKSSYRSIFKATSLFGGVQVYQILIQIIRSKFIAVLLGTSGVGILGLYQSSTDLIKQLSSLGLSQSAIRDVSEANGSGDFNRISKTVTVLSKLVWATGLFGMIAVMILSPTLSKITFGNYDYSIPIFFLSVTLLFDQLCAGQKVILQGLRRLMELAKASSIGLTLGLIVSIPLYYMFGIQGIVPTLILNSITSFIISWYYSKKVKVLNVDFTIKETLKEGKIMLRLGIAMNISGIATVISAFILRSFIRSCNGPDAVGIFTAGYSIINIYIGMVFTAMSTDFYPRLAAVHKDNAMCKKIINQQSEIGILLLSPLLIICIVIMPFVIRLLYSSQFCSAYDFIIFAAIGMFFRFASVLVAHLFLAKGASRLYIINEIVSCTYMLVLNLIGYKLMNLLGLGISFMISYMIYIVQVIIVTGKFYDFRFTTTVIKMFFIHFGLLATTLVTFLLFDSWIKYTIGVTLIIISSFLAVKGLNDKMEVLSFIKAKYLRK